MINVLPKEQKESLDKEYKLRLISVYLLLISFLAFISVFLLLPTYSVSKYKEMTLENKLKDFNDSNKFINENDLSKITLDINNTLALLSPNKTGKKNVTYDIIVPILNLRSQDIKISGISYMLKADGKVESIPTLELQGEATTRTALQNFKSTLSTNEHVSAVDLPISNFIKRTNIPFDITLQIK